MQENNPNEFVELTENEPETSLELEQEENQKQNTLNTRPGWTRAWETLVRLGLGETTLRIGTALISLSLILLVVWIMGDFYTAGQVEASSEKQIPTSQAAQPSLAAPPEYSYNLTGSYLEGIPREANWHTVQRSSPREEVEVYEVQKGDTIFGIAEKFGLKPQTIFWANYNTLIDDPHQLRPGQELNILPINGIYYEWHAGDGLNGVSKFFGVTPEDIINYPTNRLNKDTVGDYAAPNIEPGTWLVIPGGTREYVTWSAPLITRKDPAVARVLGPGSCGTIMDGPVGSGSFVWPTDSHVLSGFDFSPETNHFGVDLAGHTGVPIYASDNGVVVYAGWNDWGYGNVVVIDHGGNWQTLYAHLSALNVVCGSAVFKGAVIGAMGNTGNSSGAHLHFEVRLGSTRVNPWSILP